MLAVVKLENAAAAATFSGVSNGAGFVTEVITAHYQSAKSLAEAIKPLLSKPGGSVVTLGDSALFAVSDFASRLQEVDSLLARIDMADVVTLSDVPEQNTCRRLSWSRS